MEIKEVNLNEEHLFLQGVISSKEYCKSILSHEEYIEFKNDIHSNIFLTALEYFKQYGVPIGQHIFHELNEEACSILMELPEMEDNFNPDYAYSKHIEYLNKIHLEKIKETGDAEAIEKYESIKPVEIEDESFLNTNIEDDLNSLAQAQQDPVFVMPGSLGMLYNNFLVPSSFIALQGPEKTGKTWHLLEFAYEALTQGKNVVFISAGDMETYELKGRLYSRITNYPIDEHGTKEKYVAQPDCKISLSNKCGDNRCKYRKEREQIQDKLNGKSLVGVDGLPLKTPSKFVMDNYKPCPHIHECGYVRPSYWYQRRAKLPILNEKLLNRAKRRLKKKSRGADIRFKFYPSDTATVNDIENYIDTLAYKENFIPDLILIDYADILRMNGKDEREKINDTWLGLRRLSQREDREWCLITGTQADAQSYDKVKQTRNNFSGDKRKFSHVTYFVAINQTEKENSAGVQRLSPLAGRGAAYDTTMEVVVCSDFAKGKIANYSL